MSERSLFEKFGGVRPMARALNEKASTVQSWKTTGRVPSGKQSFVLSRARDLGLGVTPDDIISPLGRDPEDGDTAALQQSSCGNPDEVSARQVPA